MLEFALSLFDTGGFQTRRQGVSWNPELIWMHVGGDLFIWLACLSISLVLFYLARRRELPYPRLFVLFALFLLASGFGHLIEALMFQFPAYRFAGVWKVLTAVLAWATALALIPIIPRVMTATRTPTPAGELGDTTQHRLAAPVSLNRVKDYIIAILAAVLALLVRAAIEPLVENDHFYVLSLLAVVFVSWQCGFGPGILTLFVSMLGMIYFFLGEERTFVVETISDQLATAVFFFCGVCCAGLGEAQRIARRRAKAALEIALERKAELEGEVARRKEIEGALRQSEATLRAFYDSAPLPMGIVEPLADDVVHVYDNAASCRFFGVERGATANRRETALGTSPDVLALWLRKYRESGKKEEALRFEYEFDAADGQRWLSATVSPIGTDPRGRQLFCYIAEDATEQKRAAEAVRESEERWRLALDAAELGAWNIDPTTNTLTSDDRFQIIFAGAVGPIPYEQAFSLIHPDDRDHVRDAVAEATRPSNPVPYAAEYRVVRKDGTVRWVFGKGRANFAGVGSNRRIVSFNGTVADITDRKWAEKELTDRARLAALRADIAAALTAGDGTRAALQRCTETLVRHISAAFARIWMIDDAGEWLELRASAGMYTHTDGPHGRIRVGDLKIGRIAATGTPHLTNDVLHDPNVSDPAWAEREMLVAFAGYPLVVEGRVLGVMALFARHQLTQSLLADLGPVSESIAQYLERRRVEEVIRSSEQRYRTVTEAIPQIVWNTDAHGEVSYFNRRWLEYTDLPMERSHGREWTNAVHPDDRDRVYSEWRATVENGKAGNADRFAHELRLKNGATDEYRWHLSVAVPLRRTDGTIDQWIGSMADIHDQKTVAETLERMVRDRTADLMDEIEERRRAEQQVRAVAAELERSNGELEQFAYIASHDLQEPLRKIQAFGDRLRTKFRDELPDPGKEYVDRMYESSGRMRRLIDDLLNYSRVTTTARPFSRVDLARLVPEVVADLEERIERTGGTVDVGELPVLDADPTQMRQLFQNLIANAVKFHRPGVPPVVEVRGELVTAILPGDDRDSVPACRITVRDNGIGFDEKYLSRIFQVFQRLHGRNEYEGTGVGLAICRKITERHGGTITAQSRIGEGATFVVTLPVRQPREETTADVQTDE